MFAGTSFLVLLVPVFATTLKEIRGTNVPAIGTPSYHWPAWHLFDRNHWPFNFHDSLWSPHFNYPHQRPDHNLQKAMAPFSTPEMLAPLDFKETEKNFILEMDFPGMKKEEMDVSIRGSTLTISGHRRFEEKKDGENYHQVERFYGHTSRSFTLPSNANENEIEASYVDGVLQLTIPKRLHEDGMCPNGAKKIPIAEG